MDEYLANEIVVSELKEAYCLRRDCFMGEDEYHESVIVMDACLILLDYFMDYDEFVSWKSEENIIDQTT